MYVVELPWWRYPLAIILFLAIFLPIASIILPGENDEEKTWNHPNLCGCEYCLGTKPKPEQSAFYSFKLTGKGGGIPLMASLFGFVNLWFLIPAIWNWLWGAGNKWQVITLIIVELILLWIVSVTGPPTVS